ncbi:MAG TPA: beta-sandwich domain-containing protein, partial [Bdellovibrio sp.]|nr:beta-sandwich domain-containing protein [Bdellovibrio sp.]
GMRIHDATVYLASGSQVKVREYWETPIFYSGDRAVSERLNLPEFVVAIDIRAEAMGGFANALITVNTNYGYPVLNVSRY